MLKAYQQISCHKSWYIVGRAWRRWRQSCVTPAASYTCPGTAALICKLSGFLKGLLTTKQTLRRAVSHHLQNRPQLSMVLPFTSYLPFKPFQYSLYSCLPYALGHLVHFCSFTFSLRHAKAILPILCPELTIEFLSCFFLSVFFSDDI